MKDIQDLLDELEDLAWNHADSYKISRARNQIDEVLKNCGKRRTKEDSIQELRDYIDELQNRIDYEDYVNLINLTEEIEEDQGEK